MKESYLGKKRRWNKKGNIILDITVFAVMMFVILLIFYVVGNFWSNVNADFLSDPDFNPSGTTVNSTYSLVDTFVGSLGYIFIFLVLGMIGFLVISATMIDTHPAFFIVGLFALILIIVLGGIMGNAFNDFDSDATFAEQSSDYSTAAYLVKYLPIFILVVGILVFIVLYAKFR